MGVGFEEALARVALSYDPLRAPVADLDWRDLASGSVRPVRIAVVLRNSPHLRRAGL